MDRLSFVFVNSGSLSPSTHYQFARQIDWDRDNAALQKVKR